MKRAILAVVLLMIILGSNLGMGIVFKPSLGIDGKQSLSSNNSVSKTNESASQTKSVTPEKTINSSTNWQDAFEKQPVAHGGEWNINDTSTWANYTYAEGNETRLIVGVGGEKPADTAQLENAIAAHEAKIVNTVSMGGKVDALVVELPIVSVTSFVGDVHVMGLASYVEPNMRVQADLVPNDPYWSQQWGPQKIEADWAWNTTAGSRSVLVAIVDTGIDYNHPDLAANYVPLGYNWVSNDSDPLDDFGHGTHCAGIIAAVLNNGIGISGIAQVQIMSEKVLDNNGYGYWDWVAQGIIHAADQGANIISMSFGGYGDSELVHEAIQYAYNKGVLLVAAAGNDHTDTKMYPAGYDEVISVAATDQFDNTAYFSNYGDWIELSAPGVNIYSTMPTYHVTLNDYGYAMNYDYLSGTSMACPHVAGEAALVWSLYPNKTRDWVRMWLRTTADDLGDPGFDQYYGYGRINAGNAIEQSPPLHDLIAYKWTTPPFIEPGTSGIINATVLNFGASDETGINLQLLANDTVVDSTTIDYLASGNAKAASLVWSPLLEGTYNVAFYVVPVSGETSVDNNVLSKYIFVGVPVKAVVLRSQGNVDGNSITSWQVLSDEWYLFGNTMIDIDYSTLNKDNITYNDIKATGADVLIISCAYTRYYDWQFTDSEIEAIKEYVYEGHGLVATAGTFCEEAPNNNKLAPLFGMNDTIMFSSTYTDLLNLLNITHPLFKNVPIPLVFPSVGTAIPPDGRWDSDELAGGKYMALGHFQESAVIAYRGIVYISPWLEIIPPYYHHHLQLLYNALTWSRYQKPQHDLAAAIVAPERLQPGETTLLNATVNNMGLSDESNVALQLLIDNHVVASTVIPKLVAGSSYTLSYSWKSAVIGAHNMTAYVVPVPGEDSVINNVAGQIVRVSFEPKILVLSEWTETTGALDMIGYDYTSVSPSDFATVDLFEYNILFVGWNPPYDLLNALVARASDIAAWVAAGNGIVALAEFEEPNQWAWLPLSVSSPVYYSGDSVHILNQTHPVMYDLTDAELSNWGMSYHNYFNSYDIAYQALASGVEAGYPITLAANYGYGRIVITQQDPDYHLYFGDQEGAAKLLTNMIEWANVYFEHDLSVSLSAPTFVKTGEPILLNATVQNRGLNDEINVELQMLINGSIVESTAIPDLSLGADYSLSYSWIPPVDGVYNVTAYSSPVQGEVDLKNNVAVRMVTAARPLINPVGGQYANYTICISTNGVEIINGQWNFTYVGYVSPDEMNVTLYEFEQDVNGNYSNTQVGWMIVNVFTRMVVQDNGIYWTGMWFPGWIETNITLGSTINLLSGNATIVGNEVLYVRGRALDCWKVQAESVGYAYSFYYDKSSGLWIAMTITMSNGLASENVDLTLADTNVPIGFTFAHDLAMTLSASSSVELNQSTIVNATVYNTGLNDESNVELEILINDTVVDQLTINELLVNQFNSLIFSWTPNRTGEYNITAYAVPVSGEEYTSNNVATTNSIVFFYYQIYVSPTWVGDGFNMGWHGDDASWTLGLPFEFPFYGVNYDTIYISSNGLISFLGPDSSWGGGMPALSQKLAIAPAWMDWTTNAPYDIYIWENSTQVDIRWYVASHSDQTITANFEAILRNDGVIQLDYGDNNGTVSATVGISNGVGHMIAEDLTSLNQIQTIIFAPFIPRDVAISSVSASPYKVLTGDSVNVTVVAANNGANSESFGVTAYASSSNSTRIYFDPTFSDFNVNNVSVGYRFNVTLMVKNVEDLTAWEIRMFYDDSIVNVTRWFEPTSDPGWVFYGQTTLPVPTPPEYKYDHYGPGNGSALVASELFPWPPSNQQHSFTVSGKLCIFEFEVLAVPPGNQSLSCDLNVNNPDTCWIDSQANWYPFDVYENGYYWLGTGSPPPPPAPVQYLIGTTNVVNLAPGSPVSLTFVWNTTQVQPHSYVIWAEADVLPGEINTDNNVFHDGTVEVAKAPTASFNYSRVGELFTFDASSSTPGSGHIMSYTWDFGDGNTTTTGDPTITHMYSPNPSYNVTLTVENSDGFNGTTHQLIIAFQHDVAVLNVAPYNSWVYQSHSIMINATITNFGDFSENVTVDLYYNVTAGLKIDTETAVLAPNESQTLTFTWNTTSVPANQKYNITAVATIAVDDVPANNILTGESVTVRLLGDVNGDGKIDIRDISAAAKAFGAVGPDYRYHGSQASSNWNSDVDLNLDNKIDMRDILIVARGFGTGRSA